ncbi:MAG: hypothetical protein M3016_08145, partial [Actinomycetota bacterium]|nr:hypothetical protein [Actinomycetota bacterium]
GRAAHGFWFALERGEIGAFEDGKASQLSRRISGEKATGRDERECGDEEENAWSLHGENLAAQERFARILRSDGEWQHAS